MRVAFIAAAIALVSSPALASPSCMTQSEARAKFPAAHLWWHGPNRCWDATAPSRQRLAQRIRARESNKEADKEPKQAQSDVRAGRETSEVRTKAGWSHAPRWREAMSRMRPEDMQGTTASASAAASVDTATAPAAPRTNFWERWVDIAQHPPPGRKAGPADLAADARAAEAIVTPIRVMLGLLVLLLALGTFELVVRRPARSRID